MSTKKDLSAFINKNKKSKKPAAKPDEKAADQKEQAQVQEAKAQETLKKNTPAQGGDSSDEEVDELEVAKDNLDYGNIKEGSELTGKQDEDKKLGFGFEEDKAQEEAPVRKQTKAAGGGPMVFGGRRTFTNSKKGPKVQFADFKEGLDDLDNATTDKKKPVRVEEQKQPVEEKPKSTGPMKFKGKANLAKTGGRVEDKSDGVVKSYDFGVVYKTEVPEGERKNREEYGQRKPKDKGVPFGSKQEEEVEDAEFQVVGEKTRKQNKRRDEDSSDEDVRGG